MAAQSLLGSLKLPSQVVFLALLGACPRTLGRDRAAALIGKSSQFLARSYAAVNIARPQELATGVSEGWWLAQQRKTERFKVADQVMEMPVAPGAINVTHFELTPQGKQFFAGPEIIGDHVRLDLKAPLKPEVVEVTGITDVDAGVKEVQYRWRFADVPEPLRRLGIVKSDPSDARAILRLYDDGWRVERIAGGGG